MDMIERVARAIHATHNAPEDGKYWFHSEVSKCVLSRQMATAAIKAMMEPTPDMVEAGLFALSGADILVQAITQAEARGRIAGIREAAKLYAAGSGPETWDYFGGAYAAILSLIPGEPA